MLRPSRLPFPASRWATASVELALLLPFLCFLIALSVDYARLFYYAVTVQNCARNGAYYASNYPNNYHNYNDIYGYTDLNDAITRDATNLTPTPTYTVTYGLSASGPFNLTTKPTSDCYVCVVVNWTFQGLTRLPGIPSSVSLSRQAVMKVAPAMPNFD